MNESEFDKRATDTLLRQDMTDRFAGAAPYLRAFALVLGADAHLRAAHPAPAHSTARE